MSICLLNVYVCFSSFTKTHSIKDVYKISLMPTVLDLEYKCLISKIGIKQHIEGIGADQAAQMHVLICAFVARIQLQHQKIPFSHLSHQIVK